MAYRTIILKGDPVIGDVVGSGAITPGDLLNIDSAGAVLRHATAGGTAYPMFALEDENQGKSIDDVYTTANIVRYGIFRPGDEVVVNIADGETIAIGDFLESAGDGALREVDADASYGAIGVQSVVAQALEALSPSGADGTIKARVV